MTILDSDMGDLRKIDFIGKNCENIFGYNVMLLFRKLHH